MKLSAGARWTACAGVAALGLAAVAALASREGAPRAAAPPPAGPAPAPHAVVAVPPPPLPPAATPAVAAAAAPPLPFSVVGTWQAQGRTVVFLQRNGQSYQVDGPVQLDADYAVQAVDERQVLFTYLPLGRVQALRLDAPAVAAPRGPAVRAATAAPAPTPDSEAQSDN